MADKTDEPTTPTGENPVYDSIVDGGEPVVATVDSEPDADEAPPTLVEPEEIVVEESETVGYVDDEPEFVEDETTVVEAAREEPQAPQAAYAPQEPQAPVAPVAPQPSVVYVNAPQEPVDKGNRGFGVLISVAASIVYLIVLGIVMTIIYGSRPGGISLNFLGQAAFYVPALFFLIGSIVLVLLLNRAGWWTYVIGSLVVALFVYFATIGTVLLSNGVVMLTPEEAAEQFRLGTVSPFTIAAALVAREVMIWAGAIIASRGRKLKVRNADAKAAFERERAQARGY
jgi:hypothetical protein